MKPKRKTYISVVIPTKDEGPNTQRTISELKKTLSAFEVEFIIPCGDKASRWEMNYPFYNAADAIMYGIRHAKGDYIVTSDADDTYPAKNLPKMIDLMQSGKYDLVSSSRNGSIEAGAHPLPNRLANQLISLVIRRLFNIPCYDPTAGLRVYSGNFFRKYNIRPDMSFWVDTILAAGHRYAEVTIDYRRRSFGKSKLNRPEFAILLSLSIIRSLINRNKKWH